MTDLLVDIQDIVYKKSGKKLLYDVSFKVKKKDFITIVGPNGAGKTTLLKIMMQKLKPDSGFVRHKKKLRMGYMPQNFHVHPMIPMTVEAFLMLNNKAYQSDLPEVLKRVGLHTHQNSYLQHLSGGERQRLLLARAIIQKPDLLILDEPAQNLDMNGQLVFYKLIEELHKTYKCAILMVSHDLHMVMSSSNHVICLFHHICCHGSPQIIRKDPKFIEIFGQDLSKVVGFYHHDHDHAHQNCEGES